MNYNPDNIGKRIRNLRESNSITREKLAEHLELSASYIGLIERGSRGITINKLIKIANYFEVSIDYFLLERTDCENIITNERLKEISQMINNLDDKNYEFLIKIIKEVVQHFENYLIK